MSSFSISNAAPVAVATAALLAAAVAAPASAMGRGSTAPDTSHRQTAVGIEVLNADGAAPTVNLTQTRHDFRFGTALRSSDYLQNAALRQFTLDHFNSVTLVNGFHWQFTETNENNIHSDFLEAAKQATAAGLDLRGHAVIWPQNRAWLNPTDILPGYTYLGSDNGFSNPDSRLTPELLRARIDERIASLAGYDVGGDKGVYINEFDATNETIYRNNFDGFNYMADTLIPAGTPGAEKEALFVEIVAGWYKQMKAVRPDARLVANEFNIANAGSDYEARQHRDRIQAHLDAGAPIDAIGLQLHMNRVNTYEELMDRFDILAETGLEIEITEFDNGFGNNDFEGGRPFTAAEEAANLDAALRAAWDHPAVTGFTMWGFDDATHWRDNAPLLDGDLNIKSVEAAPWFDLVEGQWISSATGLVDGDTDTYTRGTYEVEIDGVTTTLEITTNNGRIIVDALANTAYLAGDFNGDGVLDANDTEAFVLALQSPGAYTQAYGLDPLARADVNTDGVINELDFSAFQDFFDAGTAPVLSVPIPEPASLALVAVGATLLLRRSRAA